MGSWQNFRGVKLFFRYLVGGFHIEFVPKEGLWHLYLITKMLGEDCYMKFFHPPYELTNENPLTWLYNYIYNWSSIAMPNIYITFLISNPFIFHTHRHSFGPKCVWEVIQPAFSRLSMKWGNACIVKLCDCATRSQHTEVDESRSKEQTNKQKH